MLDGISTTHYYISLLTTAAQLALYTIRPCHNSLHLSHHIIHRHSFAMLSPLLLLATLALLAVGARAFDFPDCTNGPLAGTPICDETLPYLTRARWIVSQMNVTEKVLRLQNGSPAIDRLGLPAYEWWSEALHGVAGSPGVTFPASGNFSCATSFPEPIGLGATFDRQLVYDVAMTTSTEGRAFSNYGFAGLDFWTPNSRHTHTVSAARLSLVVSIPFLSHLCCVVFHVQSTSSVIRDGVEGRRRLVRTPT